MRHSSRASYGCSTCRRRKVKVGGHPRTAFESGYCTDHSCLSQCDEAKPICDNCRRLKSECWYPDTFDVVHRDQTVLAKRDAQKKWRRRAADQDQQPAQTIVAPVTNDSILGQTLEIPRATQSPRSLNYADWPNAAFLRFRYDFLDPPDGESTLRSTTGAITGYVTSARATNVLGSAVMAVALANYAARMHATLFFKIAQRFYLQAITSLQKFASSPDQLFDEAMLLAAHFLSLYEILSKPIIDISFSEHLAGSETMLENLMARGGSCGRDISFANSDIGVRLLKHAMLRHLGFYEPLPRWLERLLLMIKNDRIQKSMIKLSCAAVNLCAEMKVVQTNLRFGQRPSSSPQTLLAKAQVLSSSLKAWRLQSLTEYPHRRFQLRAQDRKVMWIRELFTGPGSPSFMDVPQSPRHAHGYNIYPTVILNLQCCILDLIETMEQRGFIVEEPPLRTLCSGQKEEEAISHNPRPGMSHGTISTQAHVQSAVAAVTEVGQELLRSVPHGLGIQPPSQVTILSRESVNLMTDGFPDPSSPHELTGVRGYALFWPIFNLLKSFTRPAMQQSEHRDMESFAKQLLQFLWLEVGIAQAEGYRRWYESGLPAGF